MILFYLEEMKEIHLDRYETEDGVLTNFNMHITPPNKGDLKFQFKEADGSLTFLLKGLSVRIDTDADLHNGAIKGSFKVSVDKLDVDLKTNPTKVGWDEAMRIQYSMHLKDADIKIDVVALNDNDMVPPEFQQGMLQFESSFKVAASDAMNNAFRQKTQDTINRFLDQMSTSYSIPKFNDYKTSAQVMIQSYALSPRLGDRNSLIVDFDTKSNLVGSNSRSVKDSLRSGSRFLQKSSENQLEMTRASINDDKHHVLIAPHMVSGVLANLGSGVTSYKLEDQANLQSKVKKYFGNDVELECSPHENEYPTYKASGNTIIGEQMVKCSLHPRGFKFDSLFDIDLKLNFHIHPEVDQDGKSLKAEFGKIQATQISTHDKRMEVQTTLSDKMDQRQMMPFAPEFGIQELLRNVNSKIQGNTQGTLDKFVSMIGTNNLIDIEELEKNLMPAPMRLPLPVGYKLSNPSVQIHSNGVFDISGGLIAE